VCSVTAFGRKLAFCSWGIKPENVPTADILFGHFEVQNFKYNFAKVCSSGVQVKKLLQRAPNIISGHFHIRQNRQYDEGTITYLGNPFEMDFGDKDDQKGYHILDIEKIDLKFYKNNISPKHKKIYISDAIDDAKYKKIKKEIPKNIIKFIIDKDIPSDIIEEFTSTLGKLKPKSLHVDYQVNFNKLKFDDVDQDLSCVNMETAILEFIDLMNIDNKKEVSDFTVDLYQRCS
jgi:DNA repair exonuclease SbcCD nuclease subunit